MARFRPHGRQSRRLREFDYTSPGAYFVTIVTQGRLRLLGRIDRGKARLTAAGLMVRDAWRGLPGRFPSIDIDAFVVMPDHVHGIIVIGEAGVMPTPAGDGLPVIGGAGLVPAPAGDGHPVIGGAGLVPAPAAREHGRRVTVTTDGFALGAATRAAPPDPGGTAVQPMLGDVVGAFKSLTTVAYTHGVRDHGWPEYRRRLWQRNYHERVVRDDEHLWRLRRYVIENPVRWRPP